MVNKLDFNYIFKENEVKFYKLKINEDQINTLYYITINSINCSLVVYVSANK